MRAFLHELEPGSHCPEIVNMIVEIPKNSGHKFEYDRKLGVFRLDRTLYSPMHYPGDYGFIPSTLAEDGDPLDILAVVDEPSYPGVMIAVRPVGVLAMIDQGMVDEKILSVPHGNPRFDQILDVGDLPAHTRREIEYFFTIYKDLEGKHTEVRGWSGVERAREMIEQARHRYEAARKK